MDDHRKKAPRKGGSNTGGPRGGGAGPAKGDKPFRSGGKKPFAKRGDSAGERPGKPYKSAPRPDRKPFEAREGEQRPRRFERVGDGAPAEPAGKPYRSGPRPERKPFEGRGEGEQHPRRFERGGEGAPGGQAGKPYKSGPRPERKPFEGRSEGEQRPRRFERAGGGAPAGQAGKPYKSGPRPDHKPFEGRGEGEQRPRRFERASEGAPVERSDKPFRSGPRPDRKPFEGRGEGEQRPRRFERGGESAPAGNAGKPYRSGPRPDHKPFEGAGAPRPGRRERSEHHDAGDEARPQRAERPFRARPEGKPFEKRAFGDKSGAPRFASPRRGESGPTRSGEGKRFQKSDEPSPGERIAKRLARAGIASRRDAEELIAAGRVRVNGKVLSSPAFNVLPDDTIELDGTTIPPIERTRLFLFHKPAGLVTTNRDPEGRKTVFDVLPSDLPRLMTIGRLDINTEGLLLLTNDGGLARVLELPATGWLRRYRVRVHGKVEEKALADLRDGIAVDGVFYGAIEASLDREQGTNAWLTIGLREGKNREVKNILGALGLEVTRLIRISYGPFQLGELSEGAVQELKGKMLRDQLGERLIEEAGANFDAPIARPFSNKPVRAERELDEERTERPRITRDGVQGAIGEGGLIKARKRRENTRDDALARLSTRPERGAKAGFRTERGPKKSGEREQRPIEPPGGRKVNVWMAPGARPIGKGRAEADAAKASKAHKPAGAKPFGKPRADRPGGGKGGDGPKGPRRGRSDADRRR